MLTVEQARGWYLQADPVHDFEHVLRVLALAERIGREEGADLEILRAAALLHDAALRGNSESQAERAGHHADSAELAHALLGREGWPPARIDRVVHCILAHRFRSQDHPPQTVEARVLFDADKLDAIGAVGAARAIAYAALHGSPFYAEPSRQFRETGMLELGEAHSAFHEFVFKLVRIPERLYTQTARAIARERVEYLAAFFERLQAETRGSA